MYISCRCLGSCFHPFSKCFIISPWLVHDRKISVISSSLFSQLIFILASNAMSPPSKPWKRPKRLVTDLIAIPFESLEHMYMTTTHVCGIDCISYIYTYLHMYTYYTYVYIYMQTIIPLAQHTPTHLSSPGLRLWHVARAVATQGVHLSDFQRVKVRTVCIETCINLIDAVCVV